MRASLFRTLVRLAFLFPLVSLALTERDAKLRARWWLCCAAVVVVAGMQVFAERLQTTARRTG